MARIATILAVIGLCAALLAYSLSHLGIPSVGYEGALVYGGVLLWIGAIASALAVLICAGLFFLKRIRLQWSFACAVVAVTVLFVTVRFP